MPSIQPQPDSYLHGSPRSAAAGRVPAPAAVAPPAEPSAVAAARHDLALLDMERRKVRTGRARAQGTLQASFLLAYHVAAFNEEPALTPNPARTCCAVNTVVGTALQVELQSSARAEVLRSEQQRALELLQRERQAVQAAAASADERLRRAETEMRSLSRKEEEIRAKLDRAEEQVGSWKHMKPGRGCAGQAAGLGTMPTCVEL